MNDSSGIDELNDYASLQAYFKNMQGLEAFSKDETKLELERIFDNKDESQIQIDTIRICLTRLESKISRREQLKISLHGIFDHMRENITQKNSFIQDSILEIEKNSEFQTEENLELFKITQVEMEKFETLVKNGCQGDISTQTEAQILEYLQKCADQSDKVSNLLRKMEIQTGIGMNNQEYIKEETGAPLKHKKEIARPLHSAKSETAAIIETDSFHAQYYPQEITEAQSKVPSPVLLQAYRKDVWMKEEISASNEHHANSNAFITIKPEDSAYSRSRCCSTGKVRLIPSSTEIRTSPQRNMAEKSRIRYSDIEDPQELIGNLDEENPRSRCCCF